VRAEQVALIPQCAECKRVWLPDDGDRWQAYFDTDDVLVFYCPECAEGSLGSGTPSEVELPQVGRSHFSS
jgi:hypothetical protein